MKTVEQELTPAEAKEITGGFSLFDSIVNAAVAFVRDLARPTL